MPNIVGLELEAAQAALTGAGVLNASAIGYFGSWPITVNWQTPAFAADTVLSQSVTAGNQVAANSPITLGVSIPKTAVAYP
jgi:beta-lactam-binding protein with PASTA domain